jgi:hypothetical protein
MNDCQRSRFMDQKREIEERCHLGAQERYWARYIDTHFIAWTMQLLSQSHSKHLHHHSSTIQTYQSRHRIYFGASARSMLSKHSNDNSAKNQPWLFRELTGTICKPTQTLPVGLCTTLAQADKNGHIHVISHASRQMKEYKKNY